MKPILCLLSSLLFLMACGPQPTTSPQLEGENLAQSYCVGCHVYPEPDLLDKATWESYVLPRMGYMYGIYEHDSLREQLFEPNSGRIAVGRSGLFPAQPTLEEKDWEQIQAFFLQQAPEKLPNSQANAPQQKLPGFELVIPSVRMSPPSTTLLAIDKPNEVFFGDVHTQTFYQLDAGLNIQKAAKVGHGAVDLRETSTALHIGVMGSFSPTDQASGYLFELPLKGDEKPRKLISGLQRPVAFAQADLDEDGLMDYVICEYAKWTGRLAWWQQQADGSFQPKLLRNRPGAIKAYLRDWNLDGKQDILALFGQGDEGIFLYENQGEGKFVETPLYQFPPSYGSSSFQLVDWDSDGDEDVVYTAGDNADYLPVLKPYHGIRILLNQKGTLVEHHFLPMHGAYGAAVKDFDKDGDLDIAAISFFPDFANDSTGGFRYFQNQGSQQFSSFTLPEAAWGRWIVIDSGDIEGDGDEDLILGSLAFEVTTPGSFVEDWVARGIPFIVLKNTLIQ